MSIFLSGRPEGCPRSSINLFSRGALAAAALGVTLLAPSLAEACACGCGVFDVGTGAMFPDGSGGMLFAEVDFMDQNKNWSGTSRAPADNNADKQVRTAFYTVGAQYMFNRSWGVSIDVPYWSRKFTTQDPDTGDLATFDHAALGDIRIRGIYTGFSADMSTGITFGLKLPTGDSTYANFDPDTEIGTGSTDLLLGAYHQGHLSKDGHWNYYVRGQWQEPVKTKDNYRPGNEVIGVAGAYYQGLELSSSSRITPLLQVTAAYRGHDGGTDGHPEDSGYTRLIVSPGLEFSTGRFRLYGEVGFAVVDNVSGNQLVASPLYKLSASYGF